MKLPFLFFGCALMSCWLAAPVSAQDDVPRLEGTITLANGSPAAHALVAVLSAGPRDREKSPISPHHYPDCGRHTNTDAQGRFLIQPVNKDLLYRLIVAAPGHRPDYIKDVDPLFGGAQLKLKPLRITGKSPENRAIGKILDPAGRPVAGARLEVGATRSGGGTTYSSSGNNRVDPLAVSNEKGEFFLDCTNGVSGISVTIDAARLAKLRIWLEPGKAHLIRLKSGATVTGRLLGTGKPVAAVGLTASTQEQWSEVFMRGFDVASDADGRFSLPCMPAKTRFMVYTKMKEMHAQGLALPPTAFETGADGSKLDLGDVELKPTHSIRGRVVLSDGQPVPPRVRIYLSQEKGYDSLDERLDPDGWFEFAGVPAEEISLSVRVPGYRVSAKNPNKDWLNDGRLVGKVDADLNDFFVHLEPGDRSSERDGPAASEERQPRQKPLRGAKL